jgi:hypothetical protein
MKNRFVISENDKRSILSMYGLLTEEVVEYAFKGKVVGDDDVKIEIPKINIKKEIGTEKKIVGGLNGDSEGNFDGKIKLDNTIKHYFYIKQKGYVEFEQDIDMSKLTQDSLELTLKSAKVQEFSDFVVSSKKFTHIKINVTDTNNNPLTGYNVLIKGKDKNLDSVTSESRDLNLLVLDNDIIVNKMDSEKEYTYSPSTENIFYTDQKTDEIKIQVIITKEGYEESKTKHTVSLNNSFGTFEISETDKESKIKKPISFEYKTKTPNDINIQMTQIIPDVFVSPKLKLINDDKESVTDVIATIQLVDGTNVNFTKKDDGTLNIDADESMIGKTLFVSINKEGYEKKIVKIKIQKKNKVESITLTKKGDKNRDKNRDKNLTEKIPIKFYSNGLVQAARFAYDNEMKYLMIFVGIDGNEETETVKKLLNQKDQTERNDLLNDKVVSLYYNVNYDDEDGYELLYNKAVKDTEFNTYPTILIYSLDGNPYKEEIYDVLDFKKQIKGESLDNVNTDINNYFSIS